MAKVNINGHSHQVEVEHDGDLGQVVRAAKNLWFATIQPESGPAGPAFGFTTETRYFPNLHQMDADGK